MTLAPRRSPLAFESLEGVASAIREHGGRLSSSRRLVLEALFAAGGLVSAEHIAAGQDGRTTQMEVSSVYRNLQHLEELGVVHHVHVGHGPGLYVLESVNGREYLVCECCDRVDTLNSDRLDGVRREIRSETGFEARFSHFPIVGLCAACAPGPEGGRGRSHAHPHAHGGSEPDHEHQHSHGNYVHTHGHDHVDGLEHQHQH